MTYRRVLSLALLVGMVSAYTVRSWHNPALHYHPVCHAENDLHFHVEHEACALCDFVFSLPLPVTSTENLSSSQDIRKISVFYWTDTIPSNIRMGYALRGPPVLV